MSTHSPDVSRRPSAAIRAEAATWVARLHGPNRTSEVEAGFRRWIAESPERAAAFELLTDTWDKAGRLQRRPLERVTGWRRAAARSGPWRAALATVAVAAVVTIGTIWSLRSDALVTAVGEQRTVRLEDGSRIHLNTATRVLVRYDKHVRRVTLERGEALFDVARRPDRPFVVEAGQRSITALGTEFIVRRDPQRLAVTLVAGRVAVAGGARVSEEPAQPSSARAGRDQPSPATPQASGLSPPETFTLAPGQRLTFPNGEPPRLDEPALDRLVAWRQGQVAFDDMPLAEALAEMNRYSDIQLIAAAPLDAGVRVSGIFRAGDSADFARAIARTYGLQLTERGREIVLSAR